MKTFILTGLSLFLISGDLLATNYITANGVTWVDENGNSISAPASSIASSDSVILNSPTTNPYTVSFGAQLANTGVVIINTNTSIYANVVYNSGVILLYGTINVGVTVYNSGIINGTGSVSTLSATIPPLFANSGYVNGCSGNGCVGNTSPTNIGLPPAVGADVLYDDNTTALVATDCDDNVQFKTDYTVTVGSGSVREIGNIYVAPGYTLTISSAVALQVCGVINNEGIIVIEVGGSLVQSSTNNDNVGTGSYQVIQISQNSSSKYNIWSSPINNADLLSVFPSTNTCGIYVFNASTQQWKYDWDASLTSTYYCTGNANPVNYTGFTYTDGVADGLMDTGRGYFIPGDGTINSKTYSGIVNNGTTSVTIYSTAVSTSPAIWAGNDWNLIGNPYPSGLDPSLFWAANNGNLTDGLYFWDDTTTDYVVWNATGGTTPIGFEVAVGQGFFVLTDDVVIADGTSGTISFENAMRTNTGGDFYKKENAKNTNVSVKIETPNGETNQIVVGYSAQATDGFDKLYDAHKLSGNPNIRFASMLNNEEFIIQGIAKPGFDETKTIPLMVFTTETGNHSFSEYNRENIPNNMNVYLKDNFTGNLYDLTKGNYVVELAGNQSYVGRFELVFENVTTKFDSDILTKESADLPENGTDDVATGVEDVQSSDFKLMTESGIYTLNNTNGINGNIQVISVTGTVVWSMNNVTSTSVQIDLNSVSSGIYFIQVLNNTERVYTNKIVNQ